MSVKYLRSPILWHTCICKHIYLSTHTHTHAHMHTHTHTHTLVPKFILVWLQFYICQFYYLTIPISPFTLSLCLITSFSFLQPSLSFPFVVTLSSLFFLMMPPLCLILITLLHCYPLSLFSLQSHFYTFLNAPSLSTIFSLFLSFSLSHSRCSESPFLLPSHLIC